MRALACVLAGLLALSTGPARAQAPDDALASLWSALCPGAAPGSDLEQRCLEIANGGPGSRDLSAAGNFLGEIPGQGRAATRDGAPDKAEARSELGGGWSVFASADSGRLKRRDGINEAPFDGDTWALSAGVDWAPHERWRLGLLASHAREELDFLTSDGSTRTRYGGALLMLGWMPVDALSVDAYAGWLDGDYALRRAIDYTLPDGTSVQTLASADASARRRLAGLGLSWSQPAAGWEWQVSGGVDWQRTEIEAYSETGGAGLAISVPGRSITSHRGRLDLGLSRTVSASWGVWQPLARVGWRHEFANPSRPLAVRFVGDANGTPVVFETDDADADWGEAALGAVFVFPGGQSAFIEWRQRFGHGFLDERLLALGWRIELP